MIISLIAAMDKNFLIGAQNGLPWGKLPADMKHFREKTLGKTIVMGRKTFDSIGRALPDRQNIVLTRDVGFSTERVERFESIDSLIKTVDVPELMVIGGTSIYEQFLPRANKLYLTLIDAEFDGDAYFPKVDFARWQKTEELSYSPDDKNPYKLTFVTYER